MPSPLKASLDPLTLRDKLFNAIGGGIAILVLGLSLTLLPHQSFVIPLMVSMGASTFLLFVVPHSPMAQPWPLLGGHVLSAIIGVASGHLIADPAVAGACGVGVALLVMQLLHCNHPPGAATALATAVGGVSLENMDFIWTVYAVIGNAVILFIMALVINNVMIRRRYPMRHTHHPHHQEFQESHGQSALAIDEDDIEWALGQMDGIVDVSKEDLIDIYELAVEHAEKKAG